MMFSAQWLCLKILTISLLVLNVNIFVFMSITFSSEIKTQMKQIVLFFFLTEFYNSNIVFVRIIIKARA